jgi:hypothetical protein
LRRFCEERGLEQIVKKPTRGPHLLDLVLTDLFDACATVAPGVADHAIVSIYLNSFTTAMVFYWEK